MDVMDAGPTKVNLHCFYSVPATDEGLIFHLTFILAGCALRLYLFCNHDLIT